MGDPRSTWLRGLGLATLGALLYAWAAIPSLGGAAVAWVALVPLLGAIQGTATNTAFGIGAAFGFLNGLALTTVIWPIPGVRIQHAVVPALILAVYPALWATALILARRALRNTLLQDGVALAAWIVLDHVRSHVPVLALPVGTLAQTQVENVPVIQVAAVFGEPGVTFLVLLGNLAVWRLWGREPRLHVALRAAPIALAVMAGSIVLAQPARPPATVTMAALRTDFASFGSERLTEQERDRITSESLTRAPLGVRVLLTPETSFVNLVAKPQLLQALQSWVDARDASLVVGVAQAAKFEPAAAGRNAAEQRIRAGVWILRPHARMPERYDKVLRVPFREYSPLSDAFPWPRWLVGVPMRVVAGPGPRVYELPARRDAAVTFGPMVCWEGLFAVHARRLTRDGAQVLFQVSNEGWFRHTSAGIRHNAAVRLRAVENGRWLLVASNAGPAEIVDPRGRAIASAATGHAAWVAANVEPRKELTVYTRIGDVLAYACALVCGYAAAMHFRHAPRAAGRLEPQCADPAKEAP